MDERDFYEAFRNFNIAVAPLGTNYTPDEFGRNLMNSFMRADGVVYSTSTDNEAGRLAIACNDKGRFGN